MFNTECLETIHCKFIATSLLNPLRVAGHSSGDLNSHLIWNTGTQIKDTFEKQDKGKLSPNKYKAYILNVIDSAMTITGQLLSF